MDDQAYNTNQKLKDKISDIASMDSGEIASIINQIDKVQASNTNRKIQNRLLNALAGAGCRTHIKHNNTATQAQINYNNYMDSLGSYSLSMCNDRGKTYKYDTRILPKDFQVSTPCNKLTQRNKNREL